MIQRRRAACHKQGLSSQLATSAMPSQTHVLEGEHFILVVRQDGLPAGRAAQKLIQVQAGCAGTP